jgi:hypothetical protein
MVAEEVVRLEEAIADTVGAVVSAGARVVKLTTLDKPETLGTSSEVLRATK